MNGNTIAFFRGMGSIMSIARRPKNFTRLNRYRGRSDLATCVEMLGRDIRVTIENVTGESQVIPGKSISGAEQSHGR